MHNLERRIAEWRKTLATEPNITRQMLDELETHLRENVDDLLRTGLSEPEAFDRAANQLGATSALAAEFGKVHGATWLPVKIASITAVGTALTLAIVLPCSARFGADLILGIHVYLATLGYLTVFLTGALGICFIWQRSFAEFSAARAESIRKASLIFSSVAAALTSGAIVLGAIWTQRNWGRYWDWDPKETGGLCVVAWMIFLVGANRLRMFSPRTLLLLSVPGNVIVTLAWFGANLLTKTHSYGIQTYLWLVIAAVVVNLGVFFVGFAPAGWLRHREA
jgi:hypothetical protein